MTTAAGASATHPSLVTERQPDALRVRAIAAAILLVSMTILGFGVWLTPNAKGVGTHEELGLSPCSYLAITGYPCATCGMTTAVTHAAHGQLLSAFHVQPAGALFAIALAMAAIMAFYSLVSGVSLAPLGQALWRPRVLFIVLGIVLVAWAYKALLVRGVIQ